jgi:hypothetical protein
MRRASLFLGRGPVCEYQKSLEGADPRLPLFDLASPAFATLSRPAAINCEARLSAGSLSLAASLRHSSANHRYSVTHFGSRNCGSLPNVALCHVSGRSCRLDHYAFCVPALLALEGRNFKAAVVGVLCAPNSFWWSILNKVAVQIARRRRYVMGCWHDCPQTLRGGSGRLSGAGRELMSRGL